MKPIYGIDLGTTYTKCALVGPNDDQVRSFRLDQTDRYAQKNTLSILHSAVTVGLLDGRKVAYVGTRSMEEYLEEPEQTRRFDETKLWIGADPGKRGDAPPWPFPLHDWDYRPEDIGAIILRKVKREVEAAGGPAMERVVITHPQYFKEPRRQATRQAAEIAGLELVDMLTEPDAAALGYALACSPGCYLLFDIGGGTLDVTVCRILPHRLEVLGSEGLSLGGRSFDRVIFDRMRDEYKTLYPSFDLAHLDDRTVQVWMREAERAKRTLGVQEVVAVKYGCDNRLFQGSTNRLVLKRDDFLSASNSLIRDCVECACTALRHSGLSWSDINGVIPVGGSTRLGHLRAALEETAGHELSELEVDTAIARGAAIHGHTLATKGASIASTLDPARPSDGDTASATTQVQLVGALAHRLGVKAYHPAQRRDIIVNLLPKGTSIPCKQNRTFRTVEPNQSMIEVILFEGQGEDPDLCEMVGKVELTGFQPGPVGQAVEVSIEIEQNGTKHLAVTASGKRTESSIAYDPNRVLASGDIERRRTFVASLLVL